MVNFPPPPPPPPLTTGAASNPAVRKWRIMIMGMILLVFIAIGISIFWQWYMSQKVTSQVDEALQEATDMQRRIQMQVDRSLEEANKSANQ